MRINIHKSETCIAGRIQDAGSQTAWNRECVMDERTSQEYYERMSGYLSSVMDIGEMLLKYGAEVSRVEDTMGRLCKAYGFVRSDVFTITSSIIATVTLSDERSITQTRRIKERVTDLGRVARVNALSRKICAAPCSLKELQAEVRTIQESPGVPNWLNLVMYAMISAALSIFFGGVWMDGCAAALSGLVLFVTFCLIFGGAFILFLLEVGGPIYSQMPLDEQILSSLFQSVTYRTAGFNTIPLNEMTDSSKFLGVVLMIIGGSAGSTAGGIKTTTFAVLVLSIVSIFRHRKQVEVFGRRFEDGITRSASCIFMLYLFLLIGSTMFISRFEGLPIIDVLFETASAVATVGVTTGITPSLHPISALILSCLMIFGRAGSLTFLLAFSSNKPPASSALPLEKVQIG